MKKKLKSFLILFGIFFAIAIQTHARVLENIPSHYVKVSVDPVGLKTPAETKKAVAFIDGPTLYWRGSWTHPKGLENPPTSEAVPELLVPVRLVIPGGHKLFYRPSADGELNEIAIDMHTPEVRAFRLYLPISALSQDHEFEIEYQTGLRAPMKVKTRFEPPESIVLRNRECVREGVTLEHRGSEPNLIYLFCMGDRDTIHAGLYAPMDTRWTSSGFGSKKVYNERGLFFLIPRPDVGTVAPETLTEFTLQSADGKNLTYELKFNPAYRARPVEVNLYLGPAYHYYSRGMQNGLYVSELSLFAKLSVQTKTWIKGLDAYVDVGGMLFTLGRGSNSAQVSDLRYWELNPRIGYVSPESPSESEWTLMGGWNIWMLSASAPTSGLATNLNGPELFVQYKNQGPRATPWWLNAKYALPKIDFNNYLLSLAGGFDALWVGERRPLSVNLELSRLYHSQNSGSPMAFQSVIVSLGYRLY